MISSLQQLVGAETVVHSRTVEARSHRQCCGGGREDGLSASAGIVVLEF